MTGEDVLKIPMGENDAEADTIGKYLLNLLNEVWVEGEGFSGKRPFGNSGWKYELYYALAEAKAIPATFYEYGEVDTFDKDAAIALINSAVQALYDRLP